MFRLVLLFVVIASTADASRSRCDQAKSLSQNHWEMGNALRLIAAECKESDEKVCQIARDTLKTVEENGSGVAWVVLIHKFACKD